MTDNDDPAPPRKSPPGDGSGTTDHDAHDAVTEALERALRRRRSGAIGGYGAQTDPEVPNAKRRRDLRRRRSLAFLSVVIMSLLSITLLLLYRASLRVGAREDDELLPFLDDTGVAVSPVDAVHQGASPRVAGPLPALSGADIGDDAPASIDNVPAGSASSLPKGPPPAIDIIRAPAF